MNNKPVYISITLKGYHRPSCVKISVHASRPKNRKVNTKSTRIRYNLYVATPYNIAWVSSKNYPIFCALHLMAENQGPV